MPATPRRRSPKATFSATDKCGNSAYDWNTRPTSRWCAETRVMSRPASTMRPLCGVSRPAMARMVVVLPQPDGPSSASNSPSATPRSSAGTATLAP